MEERASRRMTTSKVQNLGSRREVERLSRAWIVIDQLKARLRWKKSGLGWSWAGSSAWEHAITQTQ